MKRGPTLPTWPSYRPIEPPDPVGVDTEKWLEFLHHKWLQRQMIRGIREHRHTNRGITMKSLIIELRYEDDGDEDKQRILRAGAKSAAKHLLTTAMLIQTGKSQPQVALQSSDFFAGTEEISIYDEDDTPEGNDDTSEEGGADAPS